MMKAQLAIAGGTSIEQVPFSSVGQHILETIEGEATKIAVAPAGTVLNRQPRKREILPIIDPPILRSP